MTGRVPFGIDRPAARESAIALARVIDVQRTRPADVAHTRLPLALEVLDRCGGDPVIAICIIAALVNPDLLPPPLPVDAPPAPPLQLAPCIPDPGKAHLS